MNPKKKTMSTPDADPIPAPTMHEEEPTKYYPPLDFMSTESRTSGPDPTNNLAFHSNVPRNTPNPITTNTSVEPTESFKTVINAIIEAIPLLTAPIFYEPETVLLHMEEIRQELKDASTNYQSAVPHLRNYLQCNE